MSADRDTSDREATGWAARVPAIAAALEEAARLGHAHVGAEHVFLALLRPGADAFRLMHDLALDPVEVADALRQQIGQGTGASARVVVTSRVHAILRTLDLSTAPDAVLLRRLLEEGESLPLRYLVSRGYGPQRLLHCLAEPLVDQTRPSGGADPADSGPISRSTGASSGSVRRSPSPGPPIVPARAVPVTLPTPTLDQLGRDLTRLARLGKVANAIGRDREIEQIIVVLARTQKANPILLGEAGVGKTAIVEGLAWRIAHGDVPPVLQGKRIVELEMGVLEAGTSLRGEFEGRLQAIVQESMGAPEVILFIDEVHMLVGAGSSSMSANDAAQILKPALARGDISCIGATTQDEYARFIRKDPALERRFSPVLVGELTPDACIKVLQSVVPRMVEKQSARGHRVEVLADALQAAVRLTDKHVRDRHQPDKAIDALDTALARAVVAGDSRITAAEVAKIVSEWTGIPASQLTADEKRHFMEMESVLGQRVIGQGHAVAAVSRAVRAALAGMKPANRPIGVFLFLGPSGVGKTQLAKELASFLFGTTEALVRFDMSEYQERYAVTNLIGAARGYVDSERGGQLTEAVRRRPYCVVLLDEIEKAHPEIFNVFLAAFDDGRITDALGRTVDCSNALFILTSNLGAYESRPANEPSFTSEGSQLRQQAARFLRPELVNRLSDVIEFSALGPRELEAILEQIIDETNHRLTESQGLSLMLDGDARALLLEHGCDTRMGARPLERAVQDLIVQPIVDGLLSGRISPGRIAVGAEDGKVIVRQGNG